MSAPAPGLFDLVAGRAIDSGPGLVRSAQEHRLGGLLLAARAQGRASVEGDRLHRLVAADDAARDHHRLLWEILGFLVDDLRTDGIEVVALRGVPSELRWYELPGQRPSVDLDLWLAPGSHDRLDHILTQFAPDYATPTEAVESARRGELQHVRFEVDEVAVDLQLDPLKLGMPCRAAAELWADCRTLTRPDGGTVQVLSPAGALLSALVQLNRHRFAYLGPYEEVRRIAGDPDLDWAEFTRLVALDGLAVPVWASLAAVAEVMDIDHPRRRRPSGLRRRAWEQLWPARQRLQGDDAAEGHRHRHKLIPLMAEGRLGDARADWRRSLLPSQSLLDVNAPDRRNRGYVRRVTLDRVLGRSGR